MIINTRNGLFANAGYGGGLFNGNLGLGGHETSASRISGIGNIPAVAKAIPTYCADTKPYRDCMTVARQEATMQCEYCKANPGDAICAGYEDSPGNSKCIDAVSSMMAWDNCVPNFCSQADPARVTPSYAPYKAGDGCSTPNTIKNVQHMVGAQPDGIWGPLSQQAYETNKKVFGTSYCDLVPGCTGMSPVGPGCDAIRVTPPPAPAPAPAPVPAPVPDIQEGSNTMGLLIGASLLAAAVGGAWLLIRKKTR